MSQSRRWSCPALPRAWRAGLAVAAGVGLFLGSYWQSPAGDRASTLTNLLQLLSPIGDAHANSRGRSGRQEQFRQERRSARQEARRDDDRRDEPQRREAKRDEPKRSDRKDDDDDERADDNSRQRRGDADKNDDKAGSGNAAEDDKGTGRVAKGSGSGRRAEPEPQAPPATMIELFARVQKYLAPVPAEATKGSASPPVMAAKPAAQSMAAPKKAEPAARKPGLVWRPNDFAPRTVVRNELIAVNLDHGALQAARKLGFQVSASAQAGLVRPSMARLLTPPDLDAFAARQLLEREIPEGSFAFNRVYTIFRPAREDGEFAREDGPGRPGASGGAACGGDRCFGKTVIGWEQQLSACSRGLRVGVIDTPIDHGHVTFSGKRLNVGSFVPAGQKAAAPGHGTGIAALLVGDPAGSTPGLIPDAKLFVAEAFYANESGNITTDTFSLLAALEWLDVWKVRIVNMSFTGPKDDLVEQAIRKMTNNGVVFVAAAGNEGPTAAPAYPAAYSPVVAVTAVNSELRSYARANRGPYIDIAAPGVRIWTAQPNRKEGYESGTSFAAPFVTALLATIYADHKSSGSAETLIDKLPTRDLGAPGHDPVFGRGLALAPQNCQALRVARTPTTLPIRAATAKQQ